MIQSILMTIAMLALIRVCVQVNKKDFQPVGGSAKEKVFSGKVVVHAEVFTLLQKLVVRRKMSIFYISGSQPECRGTLGCREIVLGVPPIINFTVLTFLASRGIVKC